MDKERLVALGTVGILAGTIAIIFGTRTGTAAMVLMWVFAGLAMVAFIALPWSWYRRSLSWLRSRVIARLTPRRLSRHGDQVQLAIVARWRSTTDGAVAPQVRRDVERNIDHPSYMRPADSAPPCVRVIALVPCDPLRDAPDSQELRDFFLAWLAQTPAMALIRDLRPGQQDVTWKSWATPRRSNLRADLTGEDQAQVPVASAVLELPSSGVRLAGTDPRYAELILHVDLTTSDFAPGLPDWRRRITQALSMPAELAQFLRDLGLAVPGEPTAQFGVLLRARQSLTEIVSPGNIPTLPASSAQIVREFIGLAVAAPDGGTAEETAGQMVLDLSERDLHLNGSQTEMAGETVPPGDSGVEVRPRQAARPWPAILADALDAARSIPDEYTKALALVRIAATVAITNPGRAALLITDAELIAQSITSETHKALALVRVAEEVAAADPADAERIAKSITVEERREYALGLVAEAVAATDPDRAVRIARSIGYDFKAQILADIARTVASTDPSRAARLTDEAERIARSIDYEAEQGLVLAGIAGTIAAVDRDRAMRIARSISDDDAHVTALVRVAGAVAAVDPDRAARLTADAEPIAQSFTSEIAKAPALASIARVIAAADPDRAARLSADAERIAQSILNKDSKEYTLTRVAEEVATVDPDRSERIARSITDESAQTSILIRVARAVAAANPGRAARLTADAERIAQSPSDEYTKAMALVRVADAVAAVDPGRAS